jgi:protoheme IX farnesyltransferase
MNVPSNIAAKDAYTQPETRIRDLIALLKPRVMSLVVFSGLCGMLAAPGHLHPFLAAVGIFALAVGAGAAGAINMWYDRDIDAVMKRTQNRPIPTGQVAPSDALGFAIILSMFSVMIMGLAVNWAAAYILAFANIFYSVVYTIWLKRHSVQNIVIGGAAGAFPPMIGWVMVTGQIDLTALSLFLIIFIWTPPHFWALALYANEDYKKANVPMMPCVKGEAYTKKQMLLYTIMLWPVSALPYFTGAVHWSYLAGIAILNALFTLSAVLVLKEEEGQYRYARKMFGYSVFYLFALFLLLVFSATKV